MEVINSTQTHTETDGQTDKQTGTLRDVVLVLQQTIYLHDDCVRP